MHYHDDEGGLACKVSFRKEERLSEEIGPTFVPGDPIMYLIRFKCKANVRTVSAVFVAEESGAEVILEGEVEKKERARDTRMQTALLKQPGEPPRRPQARHLPPSPLRGAHPWGASVGLRQPARRGLPLRRGAGRPPDPRGRNVGAARMAPEQRF